MRRVREILAKLIAEENIEKHGNYRYTTYSTNPNRPPIG
jgi:hypothetical protein